MQCPNCKSYKVVRNAPRIAWKVILYAIVLGILAIPVETNTSNYGATIFMAGFILSAAVLVLHRKHYCKSCGMKI